MNTSDIIAIILIVATILAVPGYFITKIWGKKRNVRSIIKTHSSLIRVLLDCETLPTISSITKEQTDRILSLTDNEWEEWELLCNRVEKLADKYPHTIYDYINSAFPKCKNRYHYKKAVKLFVPIPRKVKAIVSSLHLEELRNIDADSEIVWKERDELRQHARTIKEKYPDGYKTYCLIHGIDSQTDRVTVSDKNQIAELQKLYEKSKAYEGWENRQNDFSSVYWHILKDVRPNDGRFVYNVSYTKPTCRGALTESTFKVWQGFCKSFSSHLLEEQEDKYKAEYDSISEFESSTRYFLDSVYDQIFEIISKFEEFVEGDLCVILIDGCKRNWSESTYDFHYSYIRELIDNSDIERLNFSEIPFVTDNGNIRGIFILDFITSNEELTTNCKLLIEHFNKSVPIIGYYSLIKEYDEMELRELAKNHEGYICSKKNDIEFIKNCILQIDKHSFFSYLAIPNTWIGEAAHAEETKELWLDDPDEYYFKTNDKEGFISGEYSIDGGKTYNTISIEGDRLDVDDVAKFTYSLFKNMGVLSQFKKNYTEVIEFMNDRGMLACH